MGVRFVDISDEDRRLIAHEVTDPNAVKEAIDYLDNLEGQIIEDLNLD
jgi:hypothetical protein